MPPVLPRVSGLIPSNPATCRIAVIRFARSPRASPSIRRARLRISVVYLAVSFILDQKTELNPGRINWVGWPGRVAGQDRAVRKSHPNSSIKVLCSSLADINPV
jgi:hypothetical protein